MRPEARQMKVMEYRPFNEIDVLELYPLECYSFVALRTYQCNDHDHHSDPASPYEIPEVPPQDFALAGTEESAGKRGKITRRSAAQIIPVGNRTVNQYCKPGIMAIRETEIKILPGLAGACQ